MSTYYFSPKGKAYFCETLNRNVEPGMPLFGQCCAKHNVTVGFSADSAYGWLGYPTQPYQCETTHMWFCEGGPETAYYDCCPEDGAHAYYCREHCCIFVYGDEDYGCCCAEHEQWYEKKRAKWLEMQRAVQSQRLI